MTDDANNPPPNNAGLKRGQRNLSAPEQTETSPLVSALDPRFELKSALESSRSTQLNRQNILRSQIAQLDAELHASIETTNSCDEQIARLAESLEASRQLALGNI